MPKEICFELGNKLMVIVLILGLTLIVSVLFRKEKRGQFIQYHKNLGSLKFGITLFLAGVVTVLLTWPLRCHPFFFLQSIGGFAGIGVSLYFILRGLWQRKNPRQGEED